MRSNDRLLDSNLDAIGVRFTIIKQVFPYRPVSLLLRQWLINKPIFIVGCGRSGTTALSRALGVHPHVIAGGEAPMLDYLGNLVYQYERNNVSYYIQSCTRIGRHDFLKRLQRICFDCAFDPKKVVRGVTKKMLQKACVPHYWLCKAFPCKDSYIGLKTLFPDAKFIYVHRCGAEVVASMAKKNWFKDLSFIERCLFWANRVEQYHYLTCQEDTVVIHQREMISTPEKLYPELIRRLDLSESPAPLRYASETLVNPMGQETRAGGLDELLKRRQGYVDWTQLEKDEFVRICGPAMKQLGYDMPF